jgi:hypothetical protein
VSDASADPSLELESFAELVRKVRIDFAAEVEPFTEAELAQFVPATCARWIGTLAELQAGPIATTPRTTKTLGESANQAIDGAGQGGAGTYATLFWIRYRNSSSPPSVLLYIKARCLGTEPVDVQHYRRAHPAFPHEPTHDQFFDEAQWESYRQLGWHIGEKLCLREGWLWATPKAARVQPTGGGHE